MKALKCILLIVVCAMAKGIINFAPSEIGSKWTYSYTNRSLNKTASQWIEIEISDRIVVDFDTLLQMKVTQEERVYRGVTILPSHIIENNSKTYFDTVIVRGDSLFEKPNFQCPIFPMWKSHSIDSDSLELGVLNEKSLYIYNNNINPGEFLFSQSLTFGQNIGLLKRSYIMNFSGTSTNISVNLISFESSGTAHVNGRALFQKADKYSPYVKSAGGRIKGDEIKYIFNLFGTHSKLNQETPTGYYLLKH